MSSIILNYFNNRPDSTEITSSKTISSGKYARVVALNPYCQINGSYVGSSVGYSSSGAVSSTTSNFLFMTGNTTRISGFGEMYTLFGGSACFTYKDFTGFSGTIPSGDIIFNFGLDGTGLENFDITLPPGVSVYFTTDANSSGGAGWSYSFTRAQLCDQEIFVKSGDVLSGGSFVYNEYTRYL